jgi:RNA polymerase sigma-70 factor (ECF subfamily)
MKNHQGAFDLQLISLLPRLRVQALALTRNASAASDLVQDAVANALAARGSFTPGTNFPAWMHRILRNRFISDTRKRRPSVDLDDVPQAALAVSAAHEDSLALKELHVAFGRLPAIQREALFMVVLHGMSYEQVAEAMGCAVGTAKSRVFRARQQLQAWLMGEAPSATPGRAQRWPERMGTDAPAHLVAAATFAPGSSSGVGWR